MNKKNKAKGKPAKNPPPAAAASTSVAIPQAASPVLDETNIKISEEHRVPEIQPISKPIKHVPEKESQKETQEPTPVKPKRHRGGKKRKQGENTSEVEITEISSQTLDGPSTIANVDIIETKPTKSSYFKKTPVTKSTDGTVDITDNDGTKVANPNKQQPIPLRKKKGKQQKNEQEGKDLVKTGSDIESNESKRDERVKVEPQNILCDLKKDNVAKSTLQKKESQNAKLTHIDDQKYGLNSELIKDVFKIEKEEYQKMKEFQPNENKTQKNDNERNEPKDAIKNTENITQAFQKSQSPKIELQKSEPIMDLPKKCESEKEKCESLKSKKQKNEPKKENIMTKIEGKSTGPLKSEICKTEPSVDKIENSETSILETLAMKTPEKFEPSMNTAQFPKEDLISQNIVTEAESKIDEKCCEKRNYQYNKDNEASLSIEENLRKENLERIETFKFVPIVSVKTEPHFTESGFTQKEIVPNLSKEQSTSEFTEMIDKEVENIMERPVISPDILLPEKKPVDIHFISSVTEHAFKGGKGKKGSKKQKEHITEISNIAEESPTQKDAKETPSPSLTREKDTDSSQTDIFKSTKKHQSDIAKNLKNIEDEMKMIMDLAPAFSNISFDAPKVSESPFKELKIDLICELPANTETSSQSIIEEATLISAHAIKDMTKDNSLEMEMWKEVIEKSLREFTELESQNESIGMISQATLLPSTVNPDVSSPDMLDSKLSTEKIDTPVSNMPFEEANKRDDISKVTQQAVLVTENKMGASKDKETEEKHPDNKPLVRCEMQDIFIPKRKQPIQVKSEPKIMELTSDSQNIQTQDQLAWSNEQKQKGKGKPKKGDKKNKHDASTTIVSQSSSAAISAEKKDSEKDKTDSDVQKEESKTEEQKGKSSGESKDCEASEQESFSAEDDVKNQTNIDDSNITQITNDDFILRKTKPVDTKEIFKPDKENDEEENAICTRPKNLLGHPNIPVASNKNDYKKEKNKNDEKINPKEAAIKIKDVSKTDLPETSQKNVQYGLQNQNKQSLTNSEDINNNVALRDSDNEEEEYVYKYSFRKVFLANTCNICKADLINNRLSCGYCNLVGYCGQRHKDDDWTQHQALCFAVSTIVHLKGLKFVYADAKSMSGQDYRLLRMQTIVSCEKILKRKLTPWEQEILLYPRMCQDSGCREFKSTLLQDCKDCSQVSFCKEYPEHLSLDHKQWCKSYKLYQVMVLHQQDKGRIEPKLPSKIITDIEYQIPPDVNILMKQMYGNEFGMEDCYYAALTQISSAPLTALYGFQIYTKALAELSKDGKMKCRIDQHNKFTIHIVGAELQFEADTLGKWEVFFLHLYPGVNDLMVTFVGPELNPSNLPLELLNKIRMCQGCKVAKRKVEFEFYDNILYHDFVKSNKFCKPDLICAFNPGLHRTTGFGGLDSWPDTIRSIISLQNVPFCVTSYTKHELPRDLIRVKECIKADDVKIYSEPTLNPFASTRPDRNFISDDEMPLIFKNYYLMVLSG